MSLFPRRRAFLGLGTNQPRPGESGPATLAAALQALADAGLRVAAAARPMRSPYRDARGRPDAKAAPVWNTVVEVHGTWSLEELARAAFGVEAAFGRSRADARVRSLDVDVLHVDGVQQGDAELTLPHPRAHLRDFVLEPWAELAPRLVPTGWSRSVLAHAVTLRSEPLGSTSDHTTAAPLPLPEVPRRRDVLRLQTDRELRSWRMDQAGRVGFVPTLGALHEGHGSLYARARAACDVVVGSIFVNPLQFDEAADLAAYPRTLEADLALLARHGCDAVYLPTPRDLYPDGFATQIVPAGAALPLEGACRDGHFAGVATVVDKLMTRVAPDVAWFGDKDAQQVAVLRQVGRDLDRGWQLATGTTIREADGLALSSRNRRLDDAARAKAPLLFRVLREIQTHATGDHLVERLGAGREKLAAEGFEVEYVAAVDERSFGAWNPSAGPGRVLAAARLGDVRLIDNLPLPEGARASAEVAG